MNDLIYLRKSSMVFMWFTCRKECMILQFSCLQALLGISPTAWVPLTLNVSPGFIFYSILFEFTLNFKNFYSLLVNLLIL